MKALLFTDIGSGNRKEAQLKCSVDEERKRGPTQKIGYKALT